MKKIMLPISHAQAVLLEEILSTAITAAAEYAQNEGHDSSERASQALQCRLFQQMHDALDARARDVVFGW